jgi:pilus assembly protein CpaC
MLKKNLNEALAEAFLQKAEMVADCGDLAMAISHLRAAVEYLPDNHDLQRALRDYCLRQTAGTVRSSGQAAENVTTAEIIQLNELRSQAQRQGMVDREGVAEGLAPKRTGFSRRARLVAGISAAMVGAFMVFLVVGFAFAPWWRSHFAPPIAESTLKSQTAKVSDDHLFMGAVIVTPGPIDKTGTKRDAVFAAHGQQDDLLVQLQLTVDKARTLATKEGFAEFLVANPAIVDVLALSNKQLYVLGKKAGLTSISLVGSDKRVIGLVNVEVSHDVDGLQRRLRRLVPGCDITVTSVNGKVLLTGTVPDAPSMSRAMVIAEQVAPQAVTNALTIAGSQQVLLEVRFIEATRGLARDLGVQWDALGKRAAASTNVPGELVSNQTPFGVAVLKWLDGGTRADVIIQALERQGLARRLAEPNLVALSGDTAAFLAGGEFPFPVQGELNKVTIELKKFGVGLAFTPTVLGKGQISLKVEPEVSELDPTASLHVNGIEVPGLMVRRASTTVELRDGQSFAIAGLLSSNQIKSQSQLPWIEEVPVLGTLFRSPAFQREETDLVIIVTPRLVRPTRPDRTLIAPFDSRPPSNDDGKSFLRGKQEANAVTPQPFQGHTLSSDYTK